MKYSFILLGIVFGFLLSRAGATSYEFYSGLFLFENLQLLWVILFAVLTGIIGISLVKYFKVHSLISRTPLSLQPRPWIKGLVVGSLMFGVGWGVSGACPGTAPAMLGQGRLPALFTIVGIGIGTWIYGFLLSKKLLIVNRGS
ncbi:hypothetical protein MNBD_GAMMA12-50 [hydrothermal vent metagenome]|uniref:Uncharacterized protein n=1 Tax=hydrothermal vent metagenome TaxID=652676 RepID=A0A3B0YK49_9ZZZZ